MFDIVAGGRAQGAFDLSQEPQKVRDRFGEHDWAKQALLARRLVERGLFFVTIDLSNHSASGTWDNHGDNIPPYGGIWNGLRPLLPVFDHVIAMGEFGRTPNLGTQGSTDGRNHWPHVMSMSLAGGGFRHGQVIGASSREGAEISERPPPATSPPPSTTTWVCRWMRPTTIIRADRTSSWIRERR